MKNTLPASIRITAKLKSECNVLYLYTRPSLRGTPAVGSIALTA
jgi:hypothetical protein